MFRDLIYKLYKFDEDAYVFDIPQISGNIPNPAPFPDGRLKYYSSSNREDYAHRNAFGSNADTMAIKNEKLQEQVLNAYYRIKTLVDNGNTVDTSSTDYSKSSKWLNLIHDMILRLSSERYVFGSSKFEVWIGNHKLPYC